MKFRTIEVSDPRLENDGLRFVTLKSAALQQRADITLYIPTAITKDSILPIVILLHGVYGSHWAWALKGAAHHVAERLILSGSIRPMILAMPSDGLWGDGSGYVKHKGKDYEKWIVEEVPEAVRQITELKPEAPIFISGLSMGGYGALRLGAKYPNLFRGISALSSITNFEDWQRFMIEEVSKVPVPEAERSVFHFLSKHRAQLPPFRFDCGTEDLLLSSNRKLREKLIDAKIPHTYEEFSGGHEWPYWEAGLERSLLFFETLLNIAD